MAKDKTELELSAKKEKKEKKDKKRKRESDVADAAAATTDDVTVTSASAKKDKKKKRKSSADVDGDAMAIDAPNGESAVVVKDEDEDEKKVKVEVPIGALVPFANPLCDDKSQKKVLKSVKKGKIIHIIPTQNPPETPTTNHFLTAAKSKALKRGVKECVKAIRKSPPTPTGSTALPVGIVILAADISPMDVISHIPVLCEDHGIPYLYVPSRAELGAAGSTKRPTSVVMLTPKAGKGVEDGAEWESTYSDLNKFAGKLGAAVKV